MVMCIKWNRNVINAMISVFILSGLDGLHLIIVTMARKKT